MLNETLKLLRASKLTTMAKHFDRWCRNPANAHRSHVECLHALAVAQLEGKKTRRIDGFLTRAGFAPAVSIANVWTHPGRGLSPRALANLQTCAWVDAGHTLVITGEHGTGKSFLAAALAREAALTRPSVHYRVVSKVLDACVDPNIKKVMGPLSRARLLVLDHFAEDFINERQGALLRDLIDERKRKSLATIFVSAKPIEEWSGVFENQDAAEAILHRVMEHATEITLEGRKKTPSKCRRKASASR